MEAPSTPDRRAELGALRRLGRTVLARYGVEDASLTLQRHEQNTTFRAEARDGRFLLRINRPGFHIRATVASEMAWLTALRRDTDLGVPEPVAGRDGSLVVVADGRICVLLRWLDGRFADRGLAPAHLARVGVLAARLQEHAATWTPPADFLRPALTTLTDAGKAASMARTAAGDGAEPTRDDADRAVGLVQTLISREAASLVERAVEPVWATTRALARAGAGYGLIHGDLHHANVLFHRGEARAIDFDDCGWGFGLYDLAVTLSELGDRPRYAELREALLEAYASIRPLPSDHAVHLDALILLRRVQLLLWILESRHHAAFRDRWRRWAGEELDAIRALAR